MQQKIERKLFVAKKLKFFHEMSDRLWWWGDWGKCHSLSFDSSAVKCNNIRVPYKWSSVFNSFNKLPISALSPFLWNPATWCKYKNILESNKKKTCCIFQPAFGCCALQMVVEISYILCVFTNFYIFFYPKMFFAVF